MNSTEQLSRGFHHLQMGELGEAKAIFDEVLKAEPKNPNALYLLGMLALQTGFIQPGTQYLIHAVNNGGTEPSLFTSLAKTLISQNNLADARSVLQHGIQLHPDHLELLVAFGKFLRGLPQLDGSLKLLKHALEIDDESSDAHLEIANTYDAFNLQELGDAHYQKAISLKPNITTYNSYALFLAKTNKDEDAIEQFNKALEFSPKSEITLNNFGFFLYTHGQIEKSIDIFERCLSLSPDNADAHALYAFPLLIKGELEKGWKEYEWRFKTASFPPPPLHLESPLWQKEPLKDKTILLIGEQGYGDTFQFVRYAKQLADMGARTIVATTSSTVELLKSATGVHDVIDFSNADIPTHDYHIYMMSLPERLNLTLDTIHRNDAYLFADQKLVQTWQDYFSPFKKFKVGIVWNGNPDQRNNAKRSCPLKALSPLFDLEDVQLFSLAKTRPQEEGPLPDQMIDLGEHLDSFSDTAAIMQNLDLVISVCTSTTHLAGALGRPIWVLLAASADWRWFLDRDDSPWYPTARLMRQEKLHDWDQLIKRVAQDLTPPKRQKLLS